ncbi:tRNA pseudouridine(55) synthase TruB [Streptococcus gallolyticus]|jgi:tRNA pseudouridine55 synthase|uniref:tRNA pseudouridine(55) synthase TruB n=1 Tax=Streptococcus gallolyticus TaxID=315405 RepID=UPI00209773FE|nr:tRNA pseudouridine(55) synthase TruB [Streptococcus gallolyticus]MCO7177971.1 tRNA pseudouridine(55) synthase TruB [Streptococcus gallolyticus]MCY7150640.1 tRNA pseudouridine(55) synthase TruB [Streptococcus gallolyticus subsp. gallolyticus]MCY7165632.1 tRNA pseudouridine(55) synthase TruB [Streptococcus gallolyticus subsp. gallolyticus]MCY7182730.1 tRNA pseudouridine(55) synthase TruB [Streptococcus gallolyticus subsp. gallolyticus]
MINGIINLRKEAGMTSHDAVFKLRKILHEKKIGHGGTLDPDVVGVLPIAVGKATRVIEYMTEAGKIYRGQICLGYSTTTEDASGERLETTPVSDVAVEEVDLALRSFIGEITQIPPMYSAVKVNGKRLYEYARAGQTVERPERHVTIHDFKRTSPLEFKDDCCYFDFEVACSKGTYIRTLSVDLGKKLGYASHMSYLEREASAGLRLENALTLAEIADKVALEDFSFLLPVEYGVMDLPRVDLTEDQKIEISFGRKIALDRKDEQLAGFYEDKLVAILEPRDDLYKPHKVFI